MQFPFEVPYSDVTAEPDKFVDAIFSCLQSEFLVMPKGAGFVEYPVFERGYEVLKRATQGFQTIDAEKISDSAFQSPISIIVLRTILGFTPPEWAYLATQRTGVEVSQSAARTIDRKIRLAPDKPIPRRGVAAKRIEALVVTASELLKEKVPAVSADKIHRLNKADTVEGAASLQAVGDIGMPYPMVLYERFLGRPFAGHRDSVSDIVGDILESAIEDALTEAGISYRKTKRAERVVGFEQAPDFIVPDEFNPKIVIEAKITEDDGTARDKVARIQQLYNYSLRDGGEDGPKYHVVACIAGRGFGVRRADMKRMLEATKGKVFTMQNLSRLVECTDLKNYRTRP